jgi:hypothetical protein
VRTSYHPSLSLCYIAQRPSSLSARQAKPEQCQQMMTHSFVFFSESMGCDLLALYCSQPIAVLRLRFYSGGEKEREKEERKERNLPLFLPSVFSVTLWCYPLVLPFGVNS